MMHASTSPFYPLFASLDVNAKMQEGEAGRRLWADCVKTVVDARKLLLETCHYIKPFIPSKVRGSEMAFFRGIWGEPIFCRSLQIYADDSGHRC